MYEHDDDEEGLAIDLPVRVAHATWSRHHAEPWDTLSPSDRSARIEEATTAVEVVLRAYATLVRLHREGLLYEAEAGDVVGFGEWAGVDIGDVLALPTWGERDMRRRQETDRD